VLYLCISPPLCFRTGVLSVPEKSQFLPYLRFCWIENSTLFPFRYFQISVQRPFPRGYVPCSFLMWLEIRPSFISSVCTSRSCFFPSYCVSQFVMIHPYLWLPFISTEPLVSMFTKGKDSIWFYSQQNSLCDAWHIPTAQLILMNEWSHDHSVMFLWVSALLLYHFTATSWLVSTSAYICSPALCVRFSITLGSFQIFCFFLSFVVNNMGTNQKLVFKPNNTLHISLSLFKATC
jgi:hypothetical protein